MGALRTGQIHTGGSKPTPSWTLKIFDPDDLAGLTPTERAIRVQGSQPDSVLDSSDSSAKKGTNSPPAPQSFTRTSSRGTDGSDGSGGPPVDNKVEGITLSADTPSTEEKVTITESYPSLATILCGVGFIGCTTISILAHFTDIFDKYREALMVIFDTLSIGSLGGTVYNALCNGKTGPNTIGMGSTD